ncbi:MAG: response regulator transcription factor [Rhodobacter sp.]|nr:response regulator transcription factor [Rhodobacter sp.]
MRIVVVEDNVSLAKGIAYRLQDDGHSVDLLHDGAAADTFLGQEGADLVILDINLPGKSGLELLAAMRRRGDPRPVILLTARSGTEDRITGLDAGADDYLGKPFAMDELAARVRALGRRKHTPPRRSLDLGSLRLDLESLQLSKDGAALDIPRRELTVLASLAEAGGRAVSKQALLDQVYGTGSETDEKVIEVYVSRLRKRLARHGVRIRVSRGIGYALAVEPP